MASNVRTIADEDGDFSDWIELYNPGSEVVSLNGFGLSDSENDPFRWVFQDAHIDPGAFLMVWASGKDRHPGTGEYARGLVREVYTEIPGSGIHDLTGHPKYPGNPDTRSRLTQVFEAPINVGDHYGQRISGLIRAPRTGSYTFWISGDDNCELYLSTGAHPDGLRRIAGVPGWTNPREWEKYTEQRSAPVVLQEGKYYYVMALMKEHEGGDHLAVGWHIPGGSVERPISGEHLYSGALNLHTNFSISAEGERITLTDPGGQLLSAMDAVAMRADMSYGRQPDGSGNWFFFAQPTPGESNLAEGFTSYLDPPEFSAPGGFYSSAFALSITHPDEDVQIIYTLDGSMPDTAHLGGYNYVYKNQYPQYAASPFGPFLEKTLQTRSYLNPLRILDRSAEPDRLTQISTTWHASPSYFPTSPVRKGVVVRARAVKPGAISSEATTASYFLLGSNQNPYHLPAISLTVQEDALFSYYDGIYVAGEVFDNWRTNNSGGSADGGTTANYWLRGDGTENPAYIEYFEPGEKLAALQQGVGIRLHGGWSRAHPLKSLRIYARNEYGASTLDYPFFNERQDNSYKRLVLRNSGNDYFNTFFRDAAIHRIMFPLHFDVQAYQPAIMFLNGEYWGIHNIRERTDKHYIARLYNLDAEQIDLLENDAGVVEGNNAHYNDMLSYIASNPLSNQASYEEIRTRVDVESFADYQIANIFAANTDWPGNNIKYWRLRTAWTGQDVPYGHDGRWRWLMYDTDFGFGLVGSANHNTMQFATAPNGPGWPNPSWSTYLLRKMLENASFKHYFITRFADLLNTAFLPQRMIAVIRDMQQVLEPVMAEHHQRWRGSAGGSIDSWNSQVNVMTSFSNLRPLHMRSHLRSFFGIASQYNVVLDVSDAQHGYIRINTVDVKSGTPGVAEHAYPWTGIYFHNIPVEVEAVALPGYRFSHWEGSETGQDSLLQITPTRNISLKAHFTRYVPDGPQLIHYWHFNNLESYALDTVYADFSIHAGLEAHITYPGTGSGYMDRVSGTALNAWEDVVAGYGLRVRNPSDTRAMILVAPSTGYRDLNLSFALQKTASGNSRQRAQYSPDNGSSWHDLGDEYLVQNDYTLHAFDLSSIQAVNSNAALQFKISFTGSEASEEAGNNRFDNIRLIGIDVETSSDVHLRGAASLDLQVFPNPATSSAMISFKVGDYRDFLYLDVMSASGSVVNRYTNLDGSDGRYAVLLDTTGMTPGLYWVRLVASTETATRQLLVIR